jgi:hypothetical protein
LSFIIASEKYLSLHTFIFGYIGAMRPRKDKGPLRNYRFLKEADEALLKLVKKTGRVQTVVLEDLLLHRREFSPHIEEFLAAEAKRSGQSRIQIIEAALLAAMPRARSSSETTGASALSDAELTFVAVPADYVQSRSSKPQPTPQIIAPENRHLAEHHKGPKSSQPRDSQNHIRARPRTRHHVTAPRRAK